MGAVIAGGPCRKSCPKPCPWFGSCQAVFNGSSCWSLGNGCGPPHGAAGLVEYLAFEQRHDVLGCRNTQQIGNIRHFGRTSGLITDLHWFGTAHATPSTSSMDRMPTAAVCMHGSGLGAACRVVRPHRCTSPPRPPRRRPSRQESLPEGRTPPDPPAQVRGRPPSRLPHPESAGSRYVFRSKYVCASLGGR